MRVLLIDGHEMFREGLALALSDYGFDVLHTCCVAEAASLTNTSPVQLAVITYDMRTQTAAEFTSALDSVPVSARLLILVEDAAEVAGLEMMTEKVAGRVLKRESIDVLANGIRRVATAGDPLLPVV